MEQSGAGQLGHETGAAGAGAGLVDAAPQAARMSNQPQDFIETEQKEEVLH